MDVAAGCTAVTALPLMATSSTCAGENTIPEDDENGAYHALSRGTDGTATDCRQQSVALLVRGIPMESNGVGLAKCLREHVAQHCGESAGLLRVDIGHNIHRHVRNGTCVMIFATAVAAESVAERLVDDPEVSPCVYEGAPLTFDRAAGRLRDHLFPSVPFEVRRLLQLDSEATFSVTDEVTADRMTALLILVSNGRCRTASMYTTQGSDAVVFVDAMACVGGNTASFVRETAACDSPSTEVCGGVATSPSHCWVVGIEQCPRRFDALLHNITAICPNAVSTGRVRLLQGDAISLLEEPPGTSTIPFPPTVVFFDPPWGGPQYAQTISELQGDMHLSAVGSNGVSAPISVRDWILESCGVLGTCLPIAPVLAWKLPTAFDTTSVAVALTTGAVSRAEGKVLDADRCFPFRFSFGAHTVLLVVAVASNAQRCASQSCCSVAKTVADTKQLWFSNSSLDALVESLAHWNATLGHHEHRPEFYDYDKKRWILLKKWIPAAKRRAGT